MRSVVQVAHAVRKLLGVLSQTTGISVVDGLPGSTEHVEIYAGYSIPVHAHSPQAAPARRLSWYPAPDSAPKGARRLSWTGMCQHKSSPPRGLSPPRGSSPTGCPPTTGYAQLLRCLRSVAPFAEAVSKETTSA